MRTLIICVDSSMGYSLFGKRLSSDKFLSERISQFAKDSVLNISPYSENLFSGLDVNLSVSEDFLDNEEGFFFIENVVFETEKFDEIILMNWNRRYPSDKKINIDESLFKRISQESMVGYSHENIVIERFRRVR